MTPLSVIPKLPRYFICSMFSAIALVGLLSSGAEGSIPSPFFDRFGVARGCAPAPTTADIIRDRLFDITDRLSVAELSSGISQLRNHFNGSARLNGNSFDVAAQKINKNAHVLPTRESLMLNSPRYSTNMKVL